MVPTPATQQHERTSAPLWLRLLVLFVVLWLGVRIVRSVTDSLVAMTRPTHATTLAGSPG